MAAELRYELRVDSATGKAALRDFRRDVERTGDKASAAGRKGSIGWEQFGQKMTRVGRSFSLYVTAPLLAVGTASIKAAADAEESESKFRAVFKAQEQSVRRWSEVHAKAINRSAFDLREYLSSIQDTLVPMGIARDQAAGLSQSIVELAIDLASFNNQAEPAVIQALTSALVGNHEAVRQFGIVITQTSLKQELFRRGFVDSSKEITEQDKLLARLGIIMRSTSDAQGDATRTAESFTNQMKGLKASITDTSIEIGERLIPRIQPLVDRLRDASRSFTELDDSQQDAVVGIGAFAAIVGPAIIVVGSLVKSLGNLKVAFGGPFTAAGLLLGAMELLERGFLAIGGPIGSAGAALVQFVNPIDRIQQALSAPGKMIDGFDRLAKVILDIRPSIAVAKDALGDFNSITQPTTEIGKNAAAALNDIVSVGVNLFPLYDEGAKSAEKLSQAQEQLLQSFKSSLQPADELESELEVLLKRFSEDQVVSLWGDKIRKAAEEHARLGGEVPPLTKKLASLVFASDELAAAWEEARKEGAALREAVDLIVIGAEEYLSTIPRASDITIDLADDIERLNQESMSLGETEEEVAEALKKAAIEAEEFANASAAADVELKKYEGGLNDAEKELEELTKAQEDANKSADDLNKTIKNLVTATLVTDLSRGLAEAILKWDGFFEVIKRMAREFAAAMIRIIIQELLLNTLVPYIEEFAKWLSKTLKGIFSGGKTPFTGGGGGGGFWGGLGNFLGGLIGLSGAGGGTGQGGGTPPFGGPFWDPSDLFPVIPDFGGEGPFDIGTLLPGFGGAPGAPGSSPLETFFNFPGLIEGAQQYEKDLRGVNQQTSEFGNTAGQLSSTLVELDGELVSKQKDLADTSEAFQGASISVKTLGNNVDVTTDSVSDYSATIRELPEINFEPAGISVRTLGNNVDVTTDSISDYTAVVGSMSEVQELATISVNTLGNNVNITSTSISDYSVSAVQAVTSTDLWIEAMRRGGHSVEELNSLLDQGAQRWDRLQHSGTNLEGVMRGFSDRAIKNLNIDLNDQAQVMLLQQNVWDEFGTQVLSTAEALTQAGLPVSEYIQNVIDWANETGNLTEEQKELLAQLGLIEKQIVAIGDIEISNPLEPLNTLKTDVEAAAKKQTESERIRSYVQQWNQGAGALYQINEFVAFARKFHGGNFASTASSFGINAVGIDVLIRNLQSLGLGFAHGGVVPGAIGQPQVVVAHGGETITPPGEGSSHVTHITVGIGTVYGEEDFEQVVRGIITRNFLRGGMVYLREE